MFVLIVEGKGNKERGKGKTRKVAEQYLQQGI
jgi:hypothetical protein